MTYPPERWRAAGQAIERRMVELAMSQTDLIKASGLSDLTIRPIQKGEPNNSRPATLAKVARALNWPPDAITRLLAGEDPSGWRDVFHIEVPGDGTDAVIRTSTSSRDYNGDINRLSAEKRRALDTMLDAFIADEERKQQE